MSIIHAQLAQSHQSSPISRLVMILLHVSSSIRYFSIYHLAYGMAAGRAQSWIHGSHRDSYFALAFAALLLSTLVGWMRAIISSLVMR